MTVLFALFSLALLSLISLQIEALQCGKRQLSHLALIYSGADSVEGEWPWHTALYIMKRNDNTPTYQCGGTLISSSFVLTAAHCTTQYHIPLPADRLILRLGITNLSTVGPTLIDHKVKKIIRHGKYNPTYHQYDVALLKTVNEVVFSDYIQPVCMPTGSTAESYKFGHVVGWGFGEGNQLKPVLQKATLGFVNALTCLSSNPVLYSFLLSKDNSNFCAGNANETNVCDGDSGGGMFVYNEQDKRWYIRGIVNAGARAQSAMKTRCDTKQFVTFGNVTYFKDWIDSKEHEKTTNLLDLDDCAADDHDSSVPEEEKPIFLQYPWVTIQEFSVPNASKIQMVCSGVLIHPQFVLSMGHCACDLCDGTELKSVRLGDYDLSSNPDTDIYGVATSTHSIPVSKVIHHPKFAITGYSHNIALIKLSRSAPVEKLNIKPICLPKALSFAGNLSVVGWKRAGDNILQREISRMQEGFLCKKVYSSINVDLDPEESFVCVDHIDDKANDCYSFKSGSSLHYLDRVDGTNRYYLKGLYAFGSSRCRLNLTDVFVDVHYYLNWIKETVEMELRR
ncbi:transmembrane protease serine 9-like [Ochlerotatus camptorhynchus]|uniref:transmembrane protease serine 9-like n=1 Tax=Ochlerotatus camptorhynchus TaxID=644619 RepID=UPI0031CEAE02